MRAAALAATVATTGTLLLGGCLGRGDDPNLTENGLGKPVVSVEFPARSQPGSTQKATLHVSNPGPGDITSLVVAFAALGDPRLPEAIVKIGSKGSNPSIARIDPAPDAVSADGVVYRFGSLAEGAETTIVFDLIVPKGAGYAANSISVYDGQAIDRARGVRLETVVE